MHGTGATRRARVLLVEDDADFAELLVDVLTRDGHEVEVVRSADALLAALTRHDLADRFDVVLSDLRLPGASSLDVLARVDEAVRPAVVLMTGAPSPEVIRAARELGIESVLPKPFDVSQLRRHVLELARAREPLL